MTLTHSTLIHLIQLNLTEYCLLSNNIYDYHIVSQGKVTVASIDDAEEFILTDVMLQFLNVFFFFNLHLEITLLNLLRKLLAVTKLST